MAPSATCSCSSTAASSAATTTVMLPSISISPTFLLMARRITSWSASTPALATAGSMREPGSTAPSGSQKPMPSIWASGTAWCDLPWPAALRH
jgi:hypothetical protein